MKTEIIMEYLLVSMEVSLFLADSDFLVAFLIYEIYYLDGILAINKLDGKPIYLL